MAAPTSRRVGGLTFYEFDPAALTVALSPRGVGSSATITQTNPKTAEEVLAARPDLLAVLDGPMFGTCSGGDYATYTCASLSYLQADAGAEINAPGNHPTSGMTIAIVNGSPYVTRGASPAPGASVAVQGYPSLVWDGAVQGVSDGGSNTSRVWRAALAVMSDNRLAFVVGVATLADFARQLAAAGARYAVYTDGGGSTRLATPGGAYTGSAEDRRVASWLGVRRDAGVSTTGVAVPLGLAAVAVAGVALLLRKR